MDSPAIVLPIAKQTNVGVVSDRYTRRKKDMDTVAKCYLSD
jgi:hypothetical protein